MRNHANKKKLSAYMWLLVLLVLTFAAFWVDINVGYTPISITDFINLITGTASKPLYLAIVGFRLPRVLMSLMVGVGLSASGCVLQGVSRNELADPGVLGINTGAAMMVALCITLLGTNMQEASLIIPASAFLGALLAGAGVYLLSYIKNEGIHPSRLILTGIALATALNAVTIMLLLRMPQEEYGFVAGWISGNIWGSSWANFRMIMPCMLILLLFVYCKSNTLNIMALGQNTATGLGMKVQKQSLMLLLGAVCLSSLCVAVGGGIAFIGLICPHLARRLVGQNHRRLLPASLLTGAILMLAADAISRTIIQPDEVSIGIVATIIGTPYFLYLLVKN